MTIQEILDGFTAEYKLACQMEGTPQITFQVSLLASWVSEAQQQIIDSVAFLESTTTITPVVGTYAYNLPADFMQSKLVTCNQIIYHPTTMEEIMKNRNDGITDSILYAITQSSTGFQINFVASPAGTVNLTYLATPGLYSPAATPPQGWGNYDEHGVFTGNLLIGDRFVPAIKYYMLSKCFVRFERKFQEEIKRLRGRGSKSSPSAFVYNFGGE